MESILEELERYLESFDLAPQEAHTISLFLERLREEAVRQEV